jgi:hypothetical protein
MKKVNIAIFPFSILLIITYGCSASTSSATDVPRLILPSNTIAINDLDKADDIGTIVHPTITNEPIKETATASIPAETNTPISKWGDIPIMKGAYDIEDRGKSLSFKIIDTVDHVYNYYLLTMTKLGYLITMSEDGRGKVRLFEKNGESIVIAIARSPLDDNVTLVQIGK